MRQSVSPAGHGRIGKLAQTKASIIAGLHRQRLDFDAWLVRLKQRVVCVTTLQLTASGKSWQTSTPGL